MPTRPGAPLKLCAYLLRFMSLKGARVCLSLGQAKFRQYVKYLTALDFQLACEIVDSNLAHPPLFGICYPKPLVAHSYLVALAASTSIIARIAKKGETHLTRHPRQALHSPLQPSEHCLQRAPPQSRSVLQRRAPRALRSQRTTFQARLPLPQPARSLPLQAHPARFHSRLRPYRARLPASQPRIHPPRYSPYPRLLTWRPC